ncbi:MAG: helix-turn-helix domain-containing protein [Burkholderiales bacterium]|nr:helix-turn-helix domain-containing protein [Burkholderiales bacterium]
MGDVSFSISADEGLRKIDAWRDALCMAFGPIEVGLNSSDDFSGFVHAYRRGQLQFNEICYRGQTLERTSKNLAAFDQEYFTFGRPVAGPLVFEQKGHNVIVEAGSLVLLNQTSPYRASTNSCYHAFSISIPKTMLQQRAPHIGSFYRLEGADKSSRGQLLINFAKYLSEGITAWTDAEMIALREQLLDLIILLMVDNKDGRLPSDDSTVRTAHRERALAYIKYNHRNPDLTPKMIAAACGISVGYLNKIFHAADLRVEHLLFMHRLETCKALLTDSAYQGLSVQQIAYKSGFNHPSHFSRLFKEKYGVSPSEFRLAPNATR